MHPALAVIAQIARTDAARLSPEITLNRLGLSSSLGLSIMQSALERRFQRRLGPLTWQTTVGEVLAAFDGAPLAAATMATPIGAGSTAGPLQASGPFGGRVHRAPGNGAWPRIGHGVDIQEIAALPELGGNGPATDFFSSHFTAAELAAAAGKPEPRAHLCGLWCAKEAIKKSDPALAALAFAEIEISHAADGRPLVALPSAPEWRRFMVTVSISHSAAYAVASALTLTS